MFDSFWDSFDADTIASPDDPPGIVEQTDGEWSVLTDTSVDPWGTSGSETLDLWNQPGDLATAVTQGGGTYTSAPAQPSFLDLLGGQIKNTIYTLGASTVAAGTASAQVKLGDLMGGANPAPSNTNTNLANKALLSKVSSAQQQTFLGGLTFSIKDRKNWPLIAVVGIVALMLFFISRR